MSISRERQRNLKFYGSAGWDFAETGSKWADTKSWFNPLLAQNKRKYLNISLEKNYFPHTATSPCGSYCSSARHHYHINTASSVVGCVCLTNKYEALLGNMIVFVFVCESDKSLKTYKDVMWCLLDYNDHGSSHCQEWDSASPPPQPGPGPSPPWGGCQWGSWQWCYL